MNHFTIIKHKLNEFQKKFYRNELIRGILLFFTIGALYFLATLFIEYFFWLNSSFRMFLFWSFVLVEVCLFVRFIGFPIFKLFGLKKGISLEASSNIIGQHFPEVNDKLINIFQLKENNVQSELLLASINQKSKALEPIPFLKAINFKNNIKFLKYTMLPLVISVLIFITDLGFFKQSITRVVNYSTTYFPPAPFSFSIKNNTLKIVQGKSLYVVFSVDGKTIPDEAIIVFNNEKHYLSNFGKGLFSYSFLNVQEPFFFHVESHQVKSKIFAVDVIKTPTIHTIEMQLNFPKYINRKNEIINNAADITIPEGTTVDWFVKTKATTSIDFLWKDKREPFANPSFNLFEHSEKIFNPIRYHIVSSNNDLKDYEDLQFGIDVIKDEFPVINVSLNMDSITNGNLVFYGQIQDDYGITKLDFVYYDVNSPNNITTIPIEVEDTTLQNFTLKMPNSNILIEEGISYEMYFQVTDNDEVNDFKISKSNVFSYRKKTTSEIEEALLKEQLSTINSLETTLENQRIEQKKLKELSNELQKKKNPNFNDKKNLDNLIKRQQQYDQMMQRQSDKLKENLLKKEETSPSLKEKQKDLQKRIEELKKSAKEEKLLKELEKLANKLNKEDLVKKAKELALQNKQKERSLSRTLELVKRFYVEQKAVQIANKFEELSKKQNSISNTDQKKLDNQKDISKKFNYLKKELDELQKDNKNLKKPLDLPDVEEEMGYISDDQNKAEENLKNNNENEAKQNQKNASNKMKQISDKLLQSLMEIQANIIDENIEDLRKILENLITFSYQQESLLEVFTNLTSTHPSFGKSLKKQNTLKTYFEHIDDSLFVLSMRLPKMSSKFQEDLSNVHYHLDQSLENFTDNKFNNGLSNQRYIIQSTNNLADYLSSMLTDMQTSMLSGKSSGKKKSNGFSLPDIIKKQGELAKQFEKGMQKSQNSGQKNNGQNDGEKEGNTQGDKKANNSSKGKVEKNRDQQENKNRLQQNDLNGELFEIYKQQALLRQQLEEQLKNQIQVKSSLNKNVKKVLQTMEELENKILEKGFTETTISKMKQLNYELLKLNTAQLHQGKDKNRISTFNQINYKQSFTEDVIIKKQYFNQLEILNRQSLPLQHKYKEKVQTYFIREKE